MPSLRHRNNAQAYVRRISPSRICIAMAMVPHSIQPPCVRILSMITLASVLVVLDDHPVTAHELELTEVHITFLRDGTFRLDVLNDPDWLLMRVEPFSGLPLSGRLEPAQRDRRLVNMEATFADWVYLYFDGHRANVVPTYIAPTRDGPRAPDNTQLGTMRLQGTVPPGARNFSFAYGLIMDPYPLVLRPDNREPITYWNVGEYETDPFALTTVTPTARWVTAGTVLAVPASLATVGFGLYWGFARSRSRQRPNGTA